MGKTKNDTLHLRMPVFLRDALKVQARKEGRSVNAIFEETLEKRAAQYPDEIEPLEYMGTSIRITDELRDKMRMISIGGLDTITGMCLRWAVDYLNEVNGEGSCVVIPQEEGE